MGKLNEAELKEAVRKLQFNWQLVQDALFIELSVKDFSEGVWVLNQVAQAAAELNHHPDLELKDYNQLKISTTTHEAKGLTDKDLALAERIDAIITRINTRE